MVIGITVGYPLLYTSTAYSSMAHLCSSGLCCFSLIIHRICWFMFQNVPNILSITSGPLAGVGRHGQGRRINISLEHSDIEMSPNLPHLCVSTICMCAVTQLEYQYCTEYTNNTRLYQNYFKQVFFYESEMLVYQNLHWQEIFRIFANQIVC